MSAIVRTTPRTVHDWSIILPQDVIHRQTSGNHPVTALKLVYEDGVEMFDGMARVLGVAHLQTLVLQIKEENSAAEQLRIKRDRDDSDARERRMNSPA